MFISVQKVQAQIDIKNRMKNLPDNGTKRVTFYQTFKLGNLSIVGSA